MVPRMSLVQLILMSMLSCAAGDISEKLKQGQGLSAPSQSSDFLGLLAPFQDGQRQNVKGGRPSGVKGGRTSGVKGGSGLPQIGAGAANPSSRVPIPFRNHDGDDDENNLDRLCNDAFHSFLCKPAGPRKRIDGRLRPGAKIPNGILTGSSSNVRLSQEVPQQSGGALLPTELDGDEGYQYPKPTNNVQSFTGPGYSYPKPPYNYDIPKNQLAYPSQVSESVQKPSNEYLPSFVSTTSAPITSTSVPSTVFSTSSPTTPSPFFNNFGSFNSPSNAIPAQVNPPTFPNQLFYSVPRPSNTLPIQTSNRFQISNQPVTYYNLPQTTFSPTQSFPLITPSPDPAVSLFTYTTRPSNQFSFIPTSTIQQPSYIYTNPPFSRIPSINQVSTPVETQPLASNEAGYFYPKPTNQNPVILPEASAASSSLSELPPNNGYLPPVGAPVPKESNIIFNSLPTTIFPQSYPTFPSSIATFSQRAPPFQSTTQKPYSFPPYTPKPTITTTLRPFFIPSTTTIRPYTFQSTQTPTTINPFVYQSTKAPSTPRPFVFTSTTPKPVVFNFASSNDVTFSAPQPNKPTNGYLPPPSQPIPSPANDFKNVLPFNQPRQPPSGQNSTPKPLAQPPSNEYLPQLDVRVGSSTNLSPNIEGGSILAAEGDAPSPDVTAPKTTERTHTLEELCRDAFHSFLCKPIDKPRKRIDGRIREGAKIPPHIMSQLLQSPSSSINRKFNPNLSGGALLSVQQESNPAVGPVYQSTNQNPQLLPTPVQNQPSFFLLSASDSSSLAKQFSRPRSPKPAIPKTTDVIEKKVSKYTLPPNFIPTIPSTTPQPTILKLTTSTTPRPNNSPLQEAATATERATVVIKDQFRSGGQLLAASAQNQGYSYPKPSEPFPAPNASKAEQPGYDYTKPKKPFIYPTTSTTAATGYDYPKPKKPFVFPSTLNPRPTRPSAASARPTFGQRLRTTQRPKPDDQKQFQLQEQQQQQEQQSQIQEDPFSQNEVFNRDNELPPASQFEILKP